MSTVVLVGLVLILPPAVLSAVAITMWLRCLREVDLDYPGDWPPGGGDDD